MTISKDLFLALLSMDVYNRGYGAGLSFDGNSEESDGSVALGNAIIVKNLNDAGLLQEAKDAGFYAVAYKTTKDIGTNDTGSVIPAGTTIISYRGRGRRPCRAGRAFLAGRGSWTGGFGLSLSARLPMTGAARAVCGF